MSKNAYIFLNLVKGLPSHKAKHLLAVLGKEILQIPEQSLAVIPGITEHDAQRIVAAKKSNSLENELRLIEREHIHVVDLFDEEYPPLLKEIENPPLVLYVKGNPAILKKTCFAIVGSRMASPYGLSMAETFSAQLAKLGLVIVSGLARGIDTAAHTAALKTGETVAVLGSGLLNLYPRENKHLAAIISNRGAVISEFPLQETPHKENFPRRNRIISGLSQGVLVVEAAERSGALITAHRACEQNREVFALPGLVNSSVSKGTHQLIKEGAKLVESLRDILEELNMEITSEATPTITRLDADQTRLLCLLGNSETTFDELLAKTNLQRSTLNKAIAQLREKGLLRETKPARFVRNQ